MKQILFALIFVLTFTTHLFAENFDHTHKTWDGLLKKYVADGLVNYRAFLKDEGSLKQYLDDLSAVTETTYQTFSKYEKMAFLINAYNAFTIRLILDHYPLKSITEIGSPFSKLNLVRGTPWKKEFFVLLGKTTTLDWIEHAKLRKDFAEPRIHFAIVCASVGCPELNTDAFTGKILESQLQSSKISFLKDTSKNSYNKERNTLYLSEIFKWFQDDFTKKSTLIEFIQEGFNEKVKADALIEYNEYSWKLNEQKH